MVTSDDSTGKNGDDPGTFSMNSNMIPQTKATEPPVPSQESPTGPSVYEVIELRKKYGLNLEFKQDKENPL
jgi:hypothetical protein